MHESEKVIYGWITKKNLVSIVVIGHDEKKIKACKEQAEAQAGGKVMFFRYNGVCVSCPGESSSDYTQEHSNQISQFIMLISNLGLEFPDCGFNAGGGRVVEMA